MTLDVRDGVVRLDPQDWVELVDTGDLPPDLAAVPGAAEAVAATRDPSVQLQLDVAGVQHLARHHAWVDPDAAALLLQVRDDEHQLMPMPPSFVAGSLARLTRLSPRKTTAIRPREAGSDTLDDLFHPDQMRRMSAFQVLGAEFAWILATSRGETDIRIAVLEGTDGRWFVEPDGERWLLAPATGTAIWRCLTTVLARATTSASDDPGQAAQLEW